MLPNSTFTVLSCHCVCMFLAAVVTEYLKVTKFSDILNLVTGFFTKFSTL